MEYYTKYILPISSNEYIWFDEHNKQIYFGYETQNDNIPSHIILSERHYGKYNNYIYIFFGSSLYKANTQNYSIKLLLWEVYNVKYLDTCILISIKKNNRHDEIIKLLPGDDTTEIIGRFLNPNTLRDWTKLNIYFK